MDLASADARFLKLQDRFAVLAGHPALTAPLIGWVRPDDKHLPRSALGRPLGELLQTATWHQLRTTPGIGHGRLGKLLDLLDRVEREIAARPDPGRPAAVIPHVGPQAEPEELGAAEWERLGEVVRRHRLGGWPLGRFAASLADLPAGLWSYPLGTFTTLPLAGVEEVPGVGPWRARQVTDVVAELARVIDRGGGDGHLRYWFQTDRLHRIAGWLERVLAAPGAPSAEDVRTELLEPLLDQLTTDLGQTTAVLVRRRWGVDGPAATLDELGQEQGRTRERVRQLTARVADVLAVRWSEGRRPLADLLVRCQADPAADRQAGWVRDVSESGYGVDPTPPTVLVRVATAWDRAGRAKLTPMPAEDLRRWAADELPDLAPSVVEGQVRAYGLLGRDPDGREVVYSRDPLDVVLAEQVADPTPVPLPTLAARLGVDERSLSGRIERDPRFFEADGLVTASVWSGFVRRGGVWKVKLDPGGELPVAELAGMVVSGLLRSGIADASAWGVRRYADEVLGAVYQARLPAAAGTFVLAEMLVRLSDGRVRPMRRRRLRWDQPHGGPPALGKSGWVATVVARAGTPLTLAELADAMRAVYQDYEDYVYSQLTSADEDGVADARVIITLGNTMRVPKLFVPAGWRLAPDGGNVSEGVRQFATRICNARHDQRLARDELDAIPWVVSLCERLSGGTVSWAD